MFDSYCLCYVQTSMCSLSQLIFDRYVNVDETK